MLIFVCASLFVVIHSLKFKKWKLTWLSMLALLYFSVSWLLDIAELYKYVDFLEKADNIILLLFVITATKLIFMDKGEKNE